jgi:DNA-binding NarL/FixJ family response regulator
MAHVTRERREAIARFRACGMSVARIADAVGIDERAVRRHISALRSMGDARAIPRDPRSPYLAHA